jgi:DNA-directed RNA polymerase subunit RPC12/RpoP
MIDTVLNLLFRCSHRRLTRPITPVMKSGQPHGDTYVVCLDCGKQFAYDVQQMQIGKAIDRSPHAGVLSPNLPRSRKKHVRLALLTALPAAVVLRGLWRRNKEKSV